MLFQIPQLKPLWMVEQVQSSAHGPEQEYRILEDTASLLPRTAAAGDSVKTRYLSQPTAIPFSSSFLPLQLLTAVVPTFQASGLRMARCQECLPSGENPD